MRVFIDAEFSTFDERFCELINVPKVVVLTDSALAACELRIDAYFSGFSDRPRHHALEDARALRLACLASLPRPRT